MTEPFFTSTAQLRSHVRLSAQIPWESFECYVDDAVETYIKRYLSEEVIDLLEPNAEFMRLARRAIAPLAVALSMDEMAVLVGDSGITVQHEKDKRSVASDKKIEKARSGLQERGLAALSDLLEFVLSLEGLDLSSCRRLEESRGLLVPSLDAFERYASLGHSHVAYLETVPLLRNLQQQLEDELTTAVFSMLMTPPADTDSPQGRVLESLKDKCRKWTVLSAASLLAGHTTREERMAPMYSVTEWKALVRPIFQDREDSGNWYARMAESTLLSIRNIMDENASLLGLAPKETSVEYRGKGKRIFSI